MNALTFYVNMCAHYMMIMNRKVVFDDKLWSLQVYLPTRSHIVLTVKGMVTHHSMQLN